MENYKDIIQKIFVVVIIAMSLGIFAPTLFPDRTRVVNHYIIQNVVNNLYHINNSSIDMNTENFSTQLYSNVSFSENNYNLNYDTLNTKTVNSTFESSTTRYNFKSFNISESTILENISITMQNLSPTNATIRFIIYNSFFNGIRYEPYLPIKLLTGNIVFQNSMGSPATKTLTNQNVTLIKGNTTGNLYFIKTYTTVSTARMAFSATNINNSICYQYRTDTGTPYLRYHNVDFAMNFSFNPIIIDFDEGLLKNGNLTNILCNFNQTLLLNLTNDINEDFDFIMYENYSLHSFIYNLDFDEYGTYQYELDLNIPILLNQTYEIIFSSFRLTLTELSDLNYYIGILQVNYTIIIGLNSTNYSHNLDFTDFFIS